MSLDQKVIVLCLAAALWIVALGLVFRHIGRLQERLLRLAADLAAAQRHRRRDADEARQQATAEVLGEVVALLDNLDRALQAAQVHAPTEPAGKALVEGVRLSERQLLDGLRRLQVQPFDAAGARFDPRLHEAVQQVERLDLPPGTVAEVYQRGYLLEGRLLRPARVAVSARRAD